MSLCSLFLNPEKMFICPKADSLSQWVFFVSQELWLGLTCGGAQCPKGFLWCLHTKDCHHLALESVLWRAVTAVAVLLPRIVLWDVVKGRWWMVDNIWLFLCQLKSWDFSSCSYACAAILVPLCSIWCFYVPLCCSALLQAMLCFLTAVVNT